jgi:hypothetical protein
MSQVTTGSSVPPGMEGGSAKSWRRSLGTTTSCPPLSSLDPQWCSEKMCGLKAWVGAKDALGAPEGGQLSMVSVA